MMVFIKKQLVPDSTARKVTYGFRNSKKYITIHQTGNTNKGADAQAHANLQSNGNSRSASWHYQVDDKEIIQSFPDNAQCWHAGDGRGNGNMNSIAIELCVNSDGDYRKTLENGAALVKHLMDKHDIPLSNVKQHNRWSGKNCPAQIRAGKGGIGWNDFLNMVEGKPKQQTKGKAKTSTKKKTKQSSKSNSKPKANLVVDGYWGKQTTRALQRYFGTPVDGEVWGQYKGNQAAQAITGGVKYGPPYGSPVIKALQRHVGATADGVLGPQTVRAMQRHLGTPVDGEIWKPSTMVKAMQKRLNGGDL